MAGPNKNFFSVEDYNLVAHFERLRKTLIEEKADGRLDKPLAFWALASDRRLPFAFLGRTLRDLLSTPFAELLATPGIGQKKISSLITLLSRATKEPSPDAVLTAAAAEAEDAYQEDLDVTVGEEGIFNASLVSEAVWVKWRDTVRRHGLTHLKLGRLTPTLQAMPTVIWHTPLGDYIDLSLADLRSLKTHGEKRVRAILEVFWIIHQALADATVSDHLEVEFVPRFVGDLERAVGELLDLPRTVSVRQVRSVIAKPILDQIELDAGPTVWRLAADRIGIDGPVRSVRELAKRMGVTRARIYQLLEDCGKVMAVRWPEGEFALGSLAERLQTAPASKDALQMFASVHNLCYPRGAHSTRLLIDRMKPGLLPVIAQSAG